MPAPPHVQEIGLSGILGLVVSGAEHFAGLTIEEVYPRTCRAGHSFELSNLRILIFQPALDVLIGYRTSQNEWPTHQPMLTHYDQR